MKLIDEEDDFPFTFLDCIDHRLQSLFEFATILRSGDNRCHIERPNLPIEKHFWDFTGDDLPCDSLDDRRLSDSWISHEHGIIF